MYIKCLNVVEALWIFMSHLCTFSPRPNSTGKKYYMIVLNTTTKYHWLLVLFYKEKSAIQLRGGTA